MLRRHFHKVGPPAEGGRAHNNGKEDHKAEELLEVHDCFMIYGGQVANASARHRKQERREVCSVKVAALVYLDWSDKPITFDQGDHPDRVPSPGKYPLVVDPVIGNIRLTKGPHGQRQQPQHHPRRDPRAPADRSVLNPDRRDAFSRDHPWETRPTPRATQSVRLLWDSLQLPKGNPHVRGGRVPRNLPRSTGEAMLRQVHGRPQLHLPQAQDAGPQRGHHRQPHVLTRVRMRCGVRGVRRGPHRRPGKPLQGGARREAPCRQLRASRNG
jgi:hypothetical protein